MTVMPLPASSQDSSLMLVNFAPGVPADQASQPIAREEAEQATSSPPIGRNAQPQTEPVRFSPCALSLARTALAALSEGRGHEKENDQPSRVSNRNSRGGIHSAIRLAGPRQGV
jgi:hypothetical protein